MIKGLSARQIDDWNTEIIKTNITAAKQLKLFKLASSI